MPHTNINQYRDFFQNKNFSNNLWLLNSICALAFAGIYSIILVLLRTPGISDLFESKSIFKTALIIHVNLSVLVWLLSCLTLIASFNSKRTLYVKMLEYAGIFSMLLMALSPLFQSENGPVMNNYVPMLDNIFFIIALSLFLVTIYANSWLIFIEEVAMIFKNNDNLPKSYPFAILHRAYRLSFFFIIQIIAICFVISFKQLDAFTNVVTINIDLYYELLYWSMGHAMQFLYTQGFIISLIYIKSYIYYLSGQLSSVRSTKINSVYIICLYINSVFCALILLGHYNYYISEDVFKYFFTYHMIYLAGIAPTIAQGLIIYEIYCLKYLDNNASKVDQQSNIAGNKIVSLHKYKLRFYEIVFYGGLFLFGYGGMIGVNISGIDVTIPAHYHGSIIGVSLIFMCIIYMIYFENSSSSSIKDVRLAKIQIMILLIGQTLHISGLAAAGGYGVLRKSPGVEIAKNAYIYMGLVGLGGLLAIIGGLLFVYICGKKHFEKKQ